MKNVYLLIFPCNCKEKKKQSNSQSKFSAESRIFFATSHLDTKLKIAEANHAHSFAAIKKELGNSQPAGKLCASLRIPNTRIARQICIWVVVGSGKGFFPPAWKSSLIFSTSMIAVCCSKRVPSTGRRLGTVELRSFDLNFVNTWFNRRDVCN